MAILKEFRTRFIELVNELELNKKTEIADKLGLTYATFSKIYTYGILPTVPVLIRIADYFKVSIEYLLGNTENDYIDLSPSPVSFKARLEYLRLKNGIASVYELSKVSHIHRNNIAQWLKKDYLPAVDDLLVLANVFGVSCDFLVGRCDDEGVLLSSPLIPPPYQRIG